MRGPDALVQFRQGISELKTTVDEALSVDSSFSTGSRNSVVELAALRAASLFEELASQLLSLSLLEDASVPSCGAILAANDEDDIHILLRTQGASSRSWNSVSTVQELLKTADNYLRPGHLFDRIRYRDDDRRAINELRIVRNAVAHPSDVAGRELKEIARSKHYQVSRPADYLLSRVGGAEEVRVLLARIEAIGIGLTTLDYSDASQFLQPERSLSGSEKVVPGSYECSKCMQVVEHSLFGKLGPCLQCPLPLPCSQCGKSTPAAAAWRRVHTHI